MAKRLQLDKRDMALIAEVIGYLRGVASCYNTDDHQYRWAEVLQARLDILRRKVWPLDG